MQDIDKAISPYACAENDGAHFLSVECSKLKVNFCLFKSRWLTLTALVQWRSML